MKESTNGKLLSKIRKIHFSESGLYVLSFIVIYSLVCWLRPMSDDWYYLTAPNPNFGISDLLPGDAFWRPFDALFGWLISFIPSAFPWLNRFVVVLAHVLNAVLLKGIMLKLGVSRQWVLFASYFFLCSSAVWAVTVSPDALNQAFSLLFGLMAIDIHLKHGGYWYLLFCIAAIFWKESGVSFFFVVPLFEIASHKLRFIDFLKNAAILKKAVLQVLFSCFVICGYFALRFILQGGIYLGSDTGTYKLDAFSLAFVKNIILLFASAMTGVDSIALLSANKSILLVGITAVLSLIFLLIWCITLVALLRKKVVVFPLICLFICILGSAAPLAILGNAGEMHAYPVLFGISVLYAYSFDVASLSMKRIWVGILAIALAFSLSSAHKLTAIYDYSAKTQNTEQKILELYDQTKAGKVLFLIVNEEKGYSVFSQSGIIGTYYGLNVRPMLDWEMPDHTHCSVDTYEDARKYANEHESKYAQIFIVENDHIDKVK